MSLPFNINLRVDPSRGDDENNDGSPASPLRSLNEAFRRCELGWRTSCRISLAPGTYDLGANPTINVPNGAGIGAEPMLISGDMEDSGLDVRVAGAGSTRGSRVNFGTVVDSSGGLTVDRWRGHPPWRACYDPSASDEPRIRGSNAVAVRPIAPGRAKRPKRSALVGVRGLLG